MKKFLAAICAACLLITGCGDSEKPDEPANNVSKTKIGVISRLNASEL